MSIELTDEKGLPLVIRKAPPMPSLPADDPMFSNELLILSPVPLAADYDGEEKA